MASHLTFLYQFGLGGLLFAFGLWIGHRHGYWSLRPGMRHNLVLLLGILAFYFIFQGALQLLSRAAEG